MSNMDKVLAAVTRASDLMDDLTEAYDKGDDVEIMRIEEVLTRLADLVPLNVRDSILEVLSIVA